VNGRGVSDPAAALQCFTIRAAAGAPRFAAREVVIDDVITTERGLTLRKSERLCIPAGRGGAAAPTHDDFKCYTARPASGTPRFTPRTVALADAYGAGFLSARKPASVCLGAGRDGAVPVDPSAELHCFDLARTSTTPRFTARTVDVTSALGDERLLLRRPTRLCVATGLSVPAPVCGDGTVDPGEECDDGNVLAGDGCDAACRSEACGNGVVEAGEVCDDGAANGADACCGTDCLPIDPDGDGTCSRDDVCPDDGDNDGDGDGLCLGPTFHPPAVGGGDPCARPQGVATWTSATLVVGRLQFAAGAQKLDLKGAFVVPAGGPPIDPVAHGLRLRLAAPDGAVVVDVTLPPGALAGWKATGKPATTFTYRDARLRRSGIKKVVVRDRSATVPGRIDVLVVGRLGNYRLPSGADTLVLTVTLNPAAVDQCADVRFALASAECRLARGTLRCRR
jgi:cysteine-rich repeat protein